MLNLEILNRVEKEKLMKYLNENYGINEIEGLIVRFGRDKIRTFTGNLSKEELLELNKVLCLEFLGLYLAKEDMGGIRLGFDASNRLKSQINKNIFEVDEKQEKEWLMGYDIVLEDEQYEKYKSERGFFTIRSRQSNEIIGCGRLIGEQRRIRNFVPKERRIKN